MDFVSLPLGRIVKVVPGAESLVRIADIKTSTAQFRPPVVKLVQMLENPVTVSVHVYLTQ